MPIKRLRHGLHGVSCEVFHSGNSSSSSGLPAGLDCVGTNWLVWGVGCRVGAREVITSAYALLHEPQKPWTAQPTPQQFALAFHERAVTGTELRERLHYSTTDGSDVQGLELGRIVTRITGRCLSLLVFSLVSKMVAVVGRRAGSPRVRPPVGEPDCPNRSVHCPQMVCLGRMWRGVLKVQ